MIKNVKVVNCGGREVDRIIKESDKYDMSIKKIQINNGVLICPDVENKKIKQIQFNNTYKDNRTLIINSSPYNIAGINHIDNIINKIKVGVKK